MKYNINWDGLTREKYNDSKNMMIDFYNENHGITYAQLENVVGLVRIGDVCFDIVWCADCGNKEEDYLVVDYYVYGIGNYSISTDGTPYEHYDGFLVDLYNIIDNDWDYEKFVEHINSEIVETLDNSDDIIKEKAMMPLRVW